MKRINIFLLTLVAAAGILAVLYFVPQKTEIHKTLDCYNDLTKERVVVEVCGTYNRFLMKNDTFEGMINIQGKRSSEGIFEFRDDKYLNMWDEYGQPREMILQFEQFSYISVFCPAYNISSEWNPEN